MTMRKERTLCPPLGAKLSTNVERCKHGYHERKWKCGSQATIRESRPNMISTRDHSVVYVIRGQQTVVEGGECWVANEFESCSRTRLEIGMHAMRILICERI
jgi:hypothetical protein